MYKGGPVSNVEQKVGLLGRYIFKSPHWAITLSLSMLFSALIGGSAFELGLRGDVAIGLLIWGVPAIISAALTPPLVRTFGGSFNPNRSALLSLITVIFMAVVVSAASAIERATQLHWIIPDGIMMALAVGMALRTLALLALSNDDMWRSVPPAITQPVLTLILLFPVYPPFGENLIYYVNLGVASVIYLIATHLFLSYIDAPLRKTVGVSGLEFLRCLLSYLTEGSSEMEEFFHKIGESVSVPVTTFGFRNGHRMKAVFVVPSLHPGPLGDIGGSSLPVALQRQIDGMVFPFHGFADHDFNPVTQHEICKVAEVVRESLRTMTYNEEATRSETIKEGTVHVLGQRFGDSVFLSVTQSPTPSEDIDYGIGLVASAEARTRGARHAALVDAHNCSDALTPNVLPGTITSFNIINASAACTESLMNAEYGSVLLGVSHRAPMWSREEGMGDTGIKVAVVEVMGQQTVYVLIDGNNMILGLRDHILRHIDANEAEIFTTDSHVVNTNSSNNYVGKLISAEPLISTIVEMVEEARRDLEPVKVGAHTAVAHNVIVFGSRRTIQLTATVNSIVSMGWALAAAIFIASLSLSILAFLLI